MINFIGSRAIPGVKYFRPLKLDEALALSQELKDTCKFIAGGTDLFPALRRGTISLKNKNLVDLWSLKELAYIAKEETGIRIGAATLLSDLEESEIIRKYVPVLGEAFSQMGSLQIRNQGTLGGNLCNASPAADTAPPLLVLGARVLLRKGDQKRVMPLEKFFLGPGQTILSQGEMLVEIQIPQPPDGGRFYFFKLGRRNAFTLSIASVATWLKMEDGRIKEIRIALGAVAPTPRRALKTEEFLRGQRMSKEIIEQGAEIIKSEVQPIDDVRASAEYRRDMASVLTKKAILSGIPLEK